MSETSDTPASAPRRRRWIVVAGILAALVAVGGGLAAWWYLQPNPHHKSDAVVRDFAAAAGGHVNAHRRAMRMIADKKVTDLSVSLASIDASSADALARLHAAAEAARARLEAIENLPVRTQENRLGRIDGRVGEAEEAIAKQAADAKALLQGTPRAASPAPAPAEKEKKKRSS